MADATDRTLLFLARLSDDPLGLAARLAAQSVVLRLPAPSPAGEIALATAATLLLRMDRAAPAVSVIAPAARAQRIPLLADLPMGEALAREHSGFSSLSRYALDEPARANAELAFANGVAGLPVASAGWVSAIGDASVEITGNPIAAAFSGVLAANEALKVLLGQAGVPLLRAPKLWRGAASLWDYTVAPTDTGPQLPDGSFDLSRVGFIGCGGIAASTLWTLALLTLTGTPALIDDDIVDITNLNRLLFANHNDIDKPKVSVAKDMLDAAGATAMPFERRWEQLSKDDQQSVDLAVVTVDTAPVRRDIQASMPRLILNGGTGDNGEYRISRHDFLDGACLTCISHGDERARSLEDNLAQFLGIPVDVLEPHIHSREPLPEALIERTSAGSDVQARLREIPARRLGQEFCDDLAVAESEAVSAPALSATPGVMLAGEIVKYALGVGTTLGTSNIVQGGVLSGPHRRWPMRLEKREGCICTDDVYRRHYERRHRPQNG